MSYDKYLLKKNVYLLFINKYLFYICPVKL
ncbi:hypothetical protein C8C84_3209 [Flavobacterium sp. 102]|nr:hypothetical protein C8C84_3209 [Flavobacterium sp. 102]